MSRNRIYYAAGGGLLGLVLLGLGWGLSSLYLVSAGVLAIAAGLAWLTLPLPLIS